MGKHNEDNARHAISVPGGLQEKILQPIISLLRITPLRLDLDVFSDMAFARQIAVPLAS
jgi:hypothetical protein